MRVSLLIGRETLLLTTVCLCFKEVTKEIPIPPKLRYLTALAGRMLEIEHTLDGAYLCEECSALVYAHIHAELGSYGEKRNGGSPH